MRTEEFLDTCPHCGEPGLSLCHGKTCPKCHEYVDFGGLLYRLNRRQALVTHLARLRSAIASSCRRIHNADMETLDGQAEVSAAVQTLKDALDDSVIDADSL